MTKQTAKLNYLKIAPRKVRLVADALKGLPVQEAEAQLLMRHQRSAPALLRLLRSAIANAKSRNLDQNKLFVSSIRVDQGPVLKRTLPRAMGRATLIQKKMSHVTLVLDEASEVYKQRFNIAIVKKEKKPKKVAPKTKKPTAKDEPKKIEEKKPGFFKRIFKRKSV